MPVKRLSEAKSRLSPYLPQSERRALVLSLATRTVRVIRETCLVNLIAVASPEAETAAHLGAEHVLDAGDLNRSLLAASRWAGNRGARGMLILPCDLPKVTADDVSAMLLPGRGIAIAATHDGGTGALYLSPPHCIEPQFGERSYARHVRAARERGIPVREIDREGLRFDLDSVEDLERFEDVLGAHNMW